MLERKAGSRPHLRPALCAPRRHGTLARGVQGRENSRSNRLGILLGWAARG